MKKHNIVKKNYDFERIISNRKFIKNKYFVLYFQENNLENYRFGISVGKKIGNAVIRNKYKRKLRVIIDDHKKLYQNNLDYIIILRRESLDLSFEQLNIEFEDLFKKQRGK